MGKIKETIDRLKSMLDKDKNSKWGENLVILIIIGVIIIIAGGTLFGGNNKKKDESNVINSEGLGDTQEVLNVDVSDGKSEMEKDIENILAKIHGVGKVTVMITYASGKEIVPYTNTRRNDNSTDEKDSSGGTRKAVQSSYESSVVYEESDKGVKKPIIAKELMPEVKGVLIVAEGASDATVRENLINSVKVLLDIPIHKIQVVEGGK
ncbi:stage III sporulation protein AG [Acetivibrio mesophilus]|uniref:Stage III sporulation protein AG n=1 Tax=Acetivibrio mesophilus TaxID=2487273 RepID=A0A4Q0I603_9FIRM|nr:stage III sporulation protein AG [Acetivibrio mesophilus]ODM25302.1 stage III sporulation protein AG [Clostridium sp. Bc-iso-3]RXE59678.1 stage III sporulation protein AG [Acetivibrio mesophilus]HHV28601.1 stage III sporulation protein AG [Clostridium sp.]